MFSPYPLSLGRGQERTTIEGPSRLPGEEGTPEDGQGEEGVRVSCRGCSGSGSGNDLRVVSRYSETTVCPTGETDGGGKRTERKGGTREEEDRGGTERRRVGECFRVPQGGWGRESVSPVYRDSKLIRDLNTVTAPCQPTRVRGRNHTSV